MRKDEIISLFQKTLTTRINPIVDAVEPEFHKDQFSELRQISQLYIDELEEFIEAPTWFHTELCLVIFDQSVQIQSRCEYYIEELALVTNSLKEFSSSWLKNAVDHIEDRNTLSSVFKWFQRISDKMKSSLPSTLDPYINLFKALHSQEAFNTAFNEYLKSVPGSESMLMSLMKFHHYKSNSDTVNLDLLLDKQRENDEIIKQYISLSKDQNSHREALSLAITRFDILFDKKKQYNQLSKSLFKQGLSFDETMKKLGKIIPNTMVFDGTIEWYSTVIVDLNMSLYRIDDALDFVFKVNTNEDVFFFRMFRTGLYGRLSSELDTEQRDHFINKIFEADRFTLTVIEEFCEYDHSWNKLVKACQKRKSRLSDINDAVRRHGDQMVIIGEEFFEMYKSAIIEYTRRDSQKDRLRTIEWGLKTILRYDKEREHIVELLATLKHMFSRRKSFIEFLRSFVNRYTLNDLLEEAETGNSELHAKLSEAVSTKYSNQHWDDPDWAESLLEKLEDQSLYFLLQKWPEKLDVLLDSHREKLLLFYVIAVKKFIVNKKHNLEKRKEMLTTAFSALSKSHSDTIFLENLILEIINGNPLKNRLNEFLSSYVKEHMASTDYDAFQSKIQKEIKAGTPVDSRNKWDDPDWAEEQLEKLEDQSLYFLLQKWPDKIEVLSDSHREKLLLFYVNAVKKFVDSKKHNLEKRKEMLTTAFTAVSKSHSDTIFLEDLIIDLIIGNPLKKQFNEFLSSYVKEHMASTDYDAFQNKIQKGIKTGTLVDSRNKWDDPDWTKEVLEKLEDQSLYFLLQKWPGKLEVLSDSHREKLLLFYVIAVKKFIVSKKHNLEKRKEMLTTAFTAVSKSHSDTIFLEDLIIDLIIENPLKKRLNEFLSSYVEGHMTSTDYDAFQSKIQKGIKAWTPVNSQNKWDDPDWVEENLSRLKEKGYLDLLHQKWPDTFSDLSPGIREEILILYRDFLGKYAASTNKSVSEKVEYLKISLNTVKNSIHDDKFIKDVLIDLIKEHPNREKLNDWFDNYLESIGY